MEDTLERYMEYLEGVKRASANTMESYRRDLKRFLTYAEQQGILTFQQMNETCLTSYVLYLERANLSPATVSRNISSIKVFFLYLIKQGFIQEDSTERIKPPKVLKKRPEILTKEEVNLLLCQPDVSTKKGLRDRAMLELLYATGIRVSELLSLKSSDINCQNGFIICTNAKKERIIPFGKGARQALTDYNSHYIKRITDQTEYFFINRSGQAFTRQGFWKLIKIYAKQAGITKDITPHMLRHSFAAHMIENGADIKAVQELLGHSDISVTQVYLQSQNKNVREVYMSTHPRA